MHIEQYRRLIRDAGQRSARYREMLPAFYSFATSAYLNNWAASFHLPPFQSGESLRDALARQERSLAADCGFRTGLRLLDIGCGVGGPALCIARYCGARVTGLNIVSRHLEIARERAAAAQLDHLVDFVHGDMMSMPFGDAAFDGAYSFDAICHAPDKQAVYAEVFRVLRPGAVFGGFDWMCADRLSAADYARWIEPVCASSALASVLSPAQARACLEGAGFTVNHCRDLAARADLSANWDLFEEAAVTITGRSGTHRVLWEHASSVARAGRAGMFTVGEWQATKEARG